MTQISEQQLSSSWKLDLRSLAIFRIGLALTIIFNLATKFTQIATSYSDLGILPRTELIDRIIPPEYWSINLITGSVLGQQLIFIGAFIAAGLLLIGYRTKLATILCWIVLLSLQNRNPDLAVFSDSCLRLIAFWAIFLPLGGSYSCDLALSTSSNIPPQRVLSAGTVGFITQVCTLHLLFCRQLFADSEMSINFWLNVLVIGLIFLLWHNHGLRIVAIAYLILAQFFFGEFLSMAILSVAWLAFIPSLIWDVLARQVYSKEIEGLRINYDKDCGFCKKVVYLLRTFLILPNVPLLEAQGNPSVYADMEKYNSWVIESDRGKRYFKWYGIAYVVGISPVLFWLEPVLRIKPLMRLGNKIYEAIANNRRFMGNLTKPLLFRPQKIQPSSVSNIIAGFCLFLAIIGNLNLFFDYSDRIDNQYDRHIEQIVNILRLDLPTTKN
ncbi:MAG: hypothetical protein AAGE96_20730 [Cyanobacteria bacterium P01_G01_bin.19]